MMVMNGLPNRIEHGVEVYRQRSEALVIALVGKELATKWWTSYNKAFKHTPEAQWELDYRVVYDYLMGHASGSFS
jgi:hypothetical protein